MSKRVGGIIFFKIDGTQYRAKGEFTTDIGAPNREAVVGMDGPHGYKEEPKTPYIEGEITDTPNISLERLFNLTDVKVTLELANGKVHALEDAWYAGDGTLSTNEGNVPVRFEGMRGEEIT
jgi:hypothetical protein